MDYHTIMLSMDYLAIDQRKFHEKKKLTTEQILLLNSINSLLILFNGELAMYYHKIILTMDYLVTD